MSTKGPHLVTHVSIIGTGKMGQAIADIATKGGHTGGLLGKDDPATGDIVVLAVPHAAMQDLLQQRSAAWLARSLLTSPTPSTSRPSTPLPSLQTAQPPTRWRPRSLVLKAFNTTFAATLAAGMVGPLTTPVLIAGDNTDAKSLFADVIAMWLQVIDAGSLRRARELEALGFLQLTLAA
jgi:predicted dinucleotide-binding enzyme